jgi:hypothetical protein
MTAACDAFKLQHKTTQIEDGKLIAYEPRVIVNITQFIAKIKIEEYVTSRVKDIKV